MSRDVKHDLVEVAVVKGELGRALKRFCARWKNSGITVALRLRRDYPRVQDRKRYKRAKALRRLPRTVAGQDRRPDILIHKQRGPGFAPPFPRPTEVCRGGIVPDGDQVPGTLTIQSPQGQ